jgi:hypothetical protein
MDIIHGHLYDNGIQQRVNKEIGVKTQFNYALYNHEIHNYHKLNFSIQDLKTGKHLTLLHLLLLQMIHCLHLII